MYASAGTALAEPDICSHVQGVFGPGGGVIDLPSAGTFECTLPAEGLTLASGATVAVNLHGSALTLKGAGAPGDAAVTVNGTLRVSDGTLTVSGGDGGDGPVNGDVDDDSGENGAGALAISGGGRAELSDVALTATGGAGGNGAVDTGDGGDTEHVGSGGAAAHGLSNAGMLTVTDGTVTARGGQGGSAGLGTNPAVSTAGGAGGAGIFNTGVITAVRSTVVAQGGDGGTGYHGGKGGQAIVNTNAGVTAFYFEDDDGTEASPLSCVGSQGGETVAEAGGTAGSDSPGCQYSYGALLDGNGAANPSKALIYTSIPVQAAVGFLDSWPSRDGFTFVGWFTASSGGDEIPSPLYPTSETPGPYYAHWAEEGGHQSESSSGSPTVTTSAQSATPTASATGPTTTTAAPSTSPAPATVSTTQPPAPSTPSAAPLPTGTDAAGLGVDDVTPSQGGDIVLTARGFQPGSTVDFWIRSTPVFLGAAVADAQGVATLAVTLDQQYVGVHHVQAVGVGPQGQTRNVAQQITIAEPPALASTGFVSWPFLLLSFELIGAGVAMVRFQRRGPAHH